MPTFENIGSPAAAGDEAVADQGGDSSAALVYLNLSKAQSDALARDMKPRVSGNDADDEASDDSRSGFDSHDSRDYTNGDSASDSLDVAPPGGGSLNAAPPNAAPPNAAPPNAAPPGLPHIMARLAAQAMQFDDCMIESSPTVGTHTEAQGSVVPKIHGGPLRPETLSTASSPTVGTHTEAQGSVVPKIHGGPPRPETLVTASSPASATLVAKDLTQ